MKHNALSLAILAGLALVVTRSRQGRRAESHERDQTTGEPLPKYQGRGRPRSYNSYETKRVATLRGEYQRTLSSLGPDGHMWDPKRLAMEIGELRLAANDQNNAKVCDGKIEFAGEPGLFTPSRYVCSETFGTTGEVMSYAKYINVQGRRRKAKKKA